MCTHMHIPMHIHIRICMRIHIHICICVHVRVCVCINVRVRVLIRVHLRVHGHYVKTLWMAIYSIVEPNICQLSLHIHT